MTFADFNLNRFLLQALDEMGYTNPTPIQREAFATIMSSKDIVGIAQTGTGKTLAYLLPILRSLSYSEQKFARVLIIVPTRELVVQLVEDLDKLTPYVKVRYTGVYGGTNINTQKQAVFKGLDILIATPGRLIDLALDGILKLKYIQKFVIDEMDEMLNLGFRSQILTILDLLPKNRQNLLFSATMTNEVGAILNDYFKNPIKIEVASSGSPLDTITQLAYPVPNFYTKINFLVELLKDTEKFKKVLVFTKNKRQANILFEEMELLLPQKTCVIHSNKTQNFRLRAVKNFEKGFFPVLIATDIIARGLDIADVTHVINFSVPDETETYIHRIGRTGRAEKQGTAIAMFTEEEAEYLGAIEEFMKKEIDVLDMPDTVAYNSQKIYEEQDDTIPEIHGKKRKIETPSGPAFHEKSEKNSKTNQGGSYRREIAKKYKKPKTRPQKRK